MESTKELGNSMEDRDDWKKRVASVMGRPGGRHR